MKGKRGVRADDKCVHGRKRGRKGKEDREFDGIERRRGREGLRNENKMERTERGKKTNEELKKRKRKKQM